MESHDGYINIDGSIMEGGGQILRMSVCLAALLRKPIRIQGIRAGRSSPGLKSQHLTGVSLVAQLTGGRLEGAVMGSTEITFTPGPIKSGNFSADTKSAGAVCLLAQICFPVALFSPGKVVLNLKGGTNADMAPQIDEYTEILLPTVKRFGLDFEFEVVRKGFFPKGGGEVNFFLSPVKELKPVVLTDPGKIKSVTGWSFCAGSLPYKVAERMSSACVKHLRESDSLDLLRDVNIDIETYKEDPSAAFGNGSGIVLLATTTTGCVLGGSALGSPRDQAEQTGRKAAEELLESVECGGCVDKFIQDQMIVFMALARGESVLQTGSLTLHTETAIHIAEKLTGAQFSVTNHPDNSKAWTIRCRGIGLTNPAF